MSRSSSVNRPFYLDVKDTLAEVGITRRQLGHWEDRGLITPELGAGVKRYTQRDIERLTVLRHLIVEQQLPLEFVKQLAQRADEPVLGTELGATQYLDIDAGEMKSKEELSDRLWQEFLVTADEDAMENRLCDLWLMLSRVLRAKYRTVASYTNRRDELRRFENGLEFTGRIEWEPGDDGKAYARLDPHIENQGFSPDDLVGWVKPQRWRISNLHYVAEELKNAGNLTAAQQRRLWSATTMEAIHAMDRPRSQPTANSSSGSPDDTGAGSPDFDDVPF